MARTYSPLRYPGGKASMINLMASILRENGLERTPYFEPYAGGCGLALGLLFCGHVSEIHINDIDSAIWAFWHSVLERTDELVEAIHGADLSIEGWREQREAFLFGSVADPLKLGFAAFYLNRTNRSGIIKGAGVIGGLDQQGTYKIDCRFNKEDLVRRIRRVSKYKRRINLYNLDAVDFLKGSNSRINGRCLFCIDPPYFNKGASLYTSFYRPDDHSRLAEQIRALKMPWIVTYDDTSAIRALYASLNQYSFDVNYSVQIKRTASELLIASPGLSMPYEVEARRVA